MKTVAIISEYNPFHTGHEYQIRKIREEFGSDTRIVAIMSSNFTQRGDVAIIDKSTRAECAVLCGVNLVLEIPFPYSMSSAEFFAKSGVKIANSLGVIDYLSFGSEVGDIDLLTDVAKKMTSDEYNIALEKEIKSFVNKDVGYPEICEAVYKKTFSFNLEKSFFTPNNILALEYLKALYTQKSKILPHTVMRLGADYSNKSITNDTHQSSSAIRELMSSDYISATEYVPQKIRNLLINSYNKKQSPCNAEKLSSAVISHFRLNSLPTNKKIHDVGGGLYNRLRNASFMANDIHTLTALADTKKYTRARIRRAIWYSFFGVTSSEVMDLPHYTQVLAMDKVGKTILKEVKKTTDFPIITKPSAYGFLSEPAKRQKILSDTADSIYQLTKPNPLPGNQSLLTSPFVSD